MQVIKVAKVNNFIEKCKFPFKKQSWDSQIGIVEWFKSLISIAWITYFLLEIKGFKKIAKPIYGWIMKIPLVDYIVKFVYQNRIEILLILSGIYLLVTFVYYVAVSQKWIKYRTLDQKDFLEYSIKNYPFQTKLINFLNRKSEFGNNIYWLDGPWGSGKTHFVRTFFQKQNRFLKIDEIYYISCFGIKTREQAEAVLVHEIENYSTFGNLDFIPGIGGLFKWFYKTVGLDLMKKNSVILFDDLERVSFVEKLNSKEESDEEQIQFRDNPADYNDIIGFIDYLANHKNRKVIVIFNDEDIPNTYEQILEPKFQPAINSFPSQIEIVTKIIDPYQIDNKEFKQILISFYQNIVLQKKDFNFRSLKNDLHSIQNQTDIGDKNTILRIFNKYKDIWEQLFGSSCNREIINFHYYILFKNNNNYKNKEKLKELSACMWNSNINDLKKLVCSFGKNKDLIFECKQLNSFTERKLGSFPQHTEILVEIYYDFQNDNLQKNYECKDTEKLTDDIDILIKNFPPTVKINGKLLSKYVSEYIEKRPDEKEYIDGLIKGVNDKAWNKEIT